MVVVIFRALVQELDAEYSQMAAHMRDLALSQFGCSEFVAVMEGQREIAVSYWPNEESVRAWKQHSEHLLAQQFGRERWYESYSVDVASVQRHYRFSKE